MISPCSNGSERRSARHLKPPTIAKHKIVLEKRLLPWADSKGCRLLKQVDVDALREFRATWPDGPLSASKNLERLRTFFRFCHASGWIKTNPALSVKPPKVTQGPTLPFTKSEMKRILACATSIRSETHLAVITERE